MPKVGIITSYVSFGNNYGAVLQATALSEQLRVLGFEPYVMPYMANNEWSHRTTNKNKERIKYIFNTKYTIGAKIEQFLNRENRRKNAVIFNNFVKKNIPLYREERMSISELKNVAGDFYGFICGSDQVWNAFNHGNLNDPGYFLDFVPPGVKRISYAPSFGVKALPAECNAGLKDYLSKFDNLSVREETGKMLIKNVTGLDVPVVLDPTLLLDAMEWDKFSNDLNMPDDYIFCYKFGGFKESTKKIREIGNKLGLPIIEPAVSTGTFSDGFELRYDIGPAEFISCIKNARLVLTDSFHASVFSIINHTPFLTFMRDADNNPKSMNSRMLDLLTKTKLTDRMILPGQSIDCRKLENVNFDCADRVITNEKLFSINYLKKSLELEIRE